MEIHDHRMHFAWIRCMCTGGMVEGGGRGGKQVMPKHEYKDMVHWLESERSNAQSVGQGPRRLGFKAMLSHDIHQLILAHLLSTYPILPLWGQNRRGKWHICHPKLKKHKTSLHYIPHQYLASFSEIAIYTEAPNGFTYVFSNFFTINLQS